ncbi:MAG: carbohydrate-binding protein [Oscillospiraceae bacterium]|nr:carbohydrate-binding protein [Oscillospiraceae bacterium]
MKRTTVRKRSFWGTLVSLSLVTSLLAPTAGMGLGALPTAAADVTRRTLYVAENGNDYTGNGSSERPYRSIKKAADEATAGTTVLIRPGTYIEDEIRPKESGREDAMIVFRPETSADIGKVIIKHKDTFTGASVTPQVRAAWLQDTGWKEEEVQHYTNAGIEYSIAARKNELTDVFDLFGRDYVWIEVFVFEGYQFARSTIDIMGRGNVVLNNQFKDLGCVYNAPWKWTAGGVYRPDVTIPVAGPDNVIRNNYFQSCYGETLCYDDHSKNCIISENTFVGTIGKNAGAGGAESSTLGGRADGNRNNAFAFNYSGGTVNGGTIWLDISVRDFTAVRNVCYNTAYFMFNESECTRNWAYENIVYNRPLDNNKRMPADPAHFTDFPAQRIESGLFSAFWDTGSTWDAHWVNNVTYDLKNGISLDRSWNNEVRNNIAYEDDASMYNANDTAGLLVKETSVNGFHAWHGIDLKGGGDLIVRNDLWYSTRKPTYVHYMDPSQPSITVDAFNAQIGSKTELAKDPMFVDAAGGDFRLREGSPAIGTGDNGVDRGAYAVYPKTDVGYNASLGLTERVNVSFAALNTIANAGDVFDLELRLSEPATEDMTFEVTPVAGDARVGKDIKFVDDPAVTFHAGDTGKTVRVEVCGDFDLDQLVVFRLVPTGTTKLEAVGARDMHLVRIMRETKRTLVVNNIGDRMGTALVEHYAPGERVVIDAKTRPGYTFDGWQVGIDAMEVTPISPDGTVSSFIMPDQNQRIQAKWKLNGTRIGVSGIALSSEALAMEAGDTATIRANVMPENATDRVVLWTSSDPLVASVDSKGVVTAQSAGTAEIIARTLEPSDKQFTARCKVTVTGTLAPVGNAIEAEEFDAQSGVQTEECNSGGEDVAYIENGDYIGFRGVCFGRGAETLDFRVASNGAAASIEVHLGAPDGKLIGTMDVTGTGGWQTWATQRCRIDKTIGVNDVYFVFKGAEGYLFNLDQFSVSCPYENDDLMGDVDLNGTVSVSDVVMLQKWLLGAADEVTCWRHGDLCHDRTLDVFDLALLKRMVLKK